MKRPWAIVVMLSVTATTSYICRVNVSTAGAFLMEDFHLSQIEMGRIFSIFLLGYAIFQIPAGLLADHFGARRVLTWSAFLWVVITVLQAFVGLDSMVNALLAFMICRLLLGIAEAPTFTAAAQGVSRWVPSKNQGAANGLVIGAVGLGSAIAPPFVSSVMVHLGWRAALVASAIPAAIIALIWLTIREPAPIEQEKLSSADGAPRSARLTTGSFALLVISYSLQGYVGYIFVSWFYLYLVQERHFGLLSGAWMSSLPWVLSIVSIPLGGWISDRLSSGKLGNIWGRRLIPILGMGLSGVLISVGARTDSAGVAAIALAFATALVLSVEGPFWATMMGISGRRSGAAGGIMNTGSNVGGLISPALTPLFAARIGWENALHIAAALSIVAALLWLWIDPNPRHD